MSTAGFELCETTATTCGLVFSNGEGCLTACKSAGLECVQSFDTADGTADVCDPTDRIGALDCKDTGHGADYCVCGKPGNPGGDMGNNDTGGDPDMGTPDGVLAFPTARGAGAYITGGRGGQVIPVTRLDDAHDGDDEPVEGTLRYALTRKFPRTIVFRVSGTIVIGDRNGDGEIDADGEYPEMLGFEGEDYSNFTVAGQTAPEGGITIKGFIYTGRVTNMIWRYVRVRKSPVFNGFDTIGINAATDVILDHVSASYGTDENATVRGETGVNESKGITVQYNLFGTAKTGSIIGTTDGEGVETTVANNFYTNISHRFPNLTGSGRHDVINNLVYNWNRRLVNVHETPKVNHINNAAVAGGKTRTDTVEVSNKTHMGSGALGARVYTAGNYITRLLEDPNADNWVSFQVFVDEGEFKKGDPSPSEIKVETPFPMLGYAGKIRTAQQIMNDLPDEVGAFRTLDENGNIVVFRDSVDTNYIAEYRANTGTDESLDVDKFVYPVIPDNLPYGDTDGDGMPDAWESANGFDPAVDDSAGDADSDGYTNLEEFLNLVDE